MKGCYKSDTLYHEIDKTQSTLEHKSLQHLYKRLNIY